MVGRSHAMVVRRFGRGFAELVKEEEVMMIWEMR
jgi:hypothetical protein